MTTKPEGCRHRWRRRSRASIGNKDRLIVVNSFSKTYNMTGWRLGWAQSSEATIKTMYKAVEFMTSNATAMVQQAGIVALRDGEPYIAELRAHYARRRAQVMASLSSHARRVAARAAGRLLRVPAHRRPDRFGRVRAAAAASRPGWRSRPAPGSEVMGKDTFAYALQPLKPP